MFIVTRKIFKIPSSGLVTLSMRSRGSQTRPKTESDGMSDVLFAEQVQTINGKVQNAYRKSHGGHVAGRGISSPKSVVGLV